MCSFLHMATNLAIDDRLLDEALRIGGHRAFPDLTLETADFEEAADGFNRCRAKGIQGSNTNFLLWAVASRRDLGLFTTDADFAAIRRVLPVQLHEPRH